MSIPEWLQPLTPDWRDPMSLAMVAASLHVLLSMITLIRELATKRRMANFTQFVLFATALVSGCLYSAAWRDGEDAGYSAVFWLVITAAWLFIAVRRYRKDHPAKPAKEVAK